jgi:hypothetical protein
MLLIITPDPLALAIGFVMIDSYILCYMIHIEISASINDPKTRVSDPVPPTSNQLNL